MGKQKCPICGEGVLKRKVNTQAFNYKGKTKSISNYITYACDECGEAIVDDVTLKESGKILKDFQREVDGLLTGKQIQAIRLKLELTQEQLADIVGGGLKSLARYESGSVCQSRGMDNLLRILDAYPETLKVIQKSPEAVSGTERVTYMKDSKEKKSYRLQEKPIFSEEEEAVYA